MPHSRPTARRVLPLLPSTPLRLTTNLLCTVTDSPRPILEELSTLPLSSTLHVPRTHPSSSITNSSLRMDRHTTHRHNRRTTSNSTHLNSSNSIMHVRIRPPPIHLI